MDFLTDLFGGGGNRYAGFDNFLQDNSMTQDMFNNFNPAEQSGIMQSYEGLLGDYNGFGMGDGFFGKNAWKNIGGATNLLSGLYGMYQSGQQMDIMKANERRNQEAFDLANSRYDSLQNNLSKAFAPTQSYA